MEVAFLIWKEAESMKIRIEEQEYSGSPIEIVDQLREESFDKEELPDVESFVWYTKNNFERMTELACDLPEGNISAQVVTVLNALASIDAIEILERD